MSGLRAAVAPALAALLACTAASQEAYRAEACTADAAREEGARDGAAGKPFHPAIADGCEASRRDALLAAYRVGFQQAAEKAGKPGVPGGRAFRCEVTPFAEPVVAYGATEAEARAATADACGKKAGALHCQAITCRVSE